MPDVNPIYFIILIAIMGLLPFFLMMVTSYVKIVVVTSLVRNALGVQQIPPAMVLNGLAIILSIFVMAPVGHQTWALAKTVDLPAAHVEPRHLSEAIETLSPPLKSFLMKNTERYVLTTLIESAKRIWPESLRSMANNESFLMLIPAFAISELTEAFKVGFLLYLPFIVIDLIISNILLAMGMMMVSPMTISLPFKLLLFVTLEGWLKVCQGLLFSYA
ncbi:MAG: type III secretion system export apparatus subunit SctR [Deltaproteobacteria bacterium]|nr:type III secretion system export apparatus subunit SctR [Deltaproteobacteria bacterium]